VHEASCLEEPGAGKLHAGICEGGVGQPASLPRHAECSTPGKATQSRIKARSKPPYHPTSSHPDTARSSASWPDAWAKREPQK